jgi:hypothetical protein
MRGYSISHAPMSVRTDRDLSNAADGVDHEDDDEVTK